MTLVALVVCLVKVRCGWFVFNRKIKCLTALNRQLYPANPKESFKPYFKVCLVKQFGSAFFGSLTAEMDYGPWAILENQLNIESK